jgi:hypothetical protein
LDSGHDENHRLTGRGGTAPALSGRVPVQKSYVRPNFLSTENARELPKCSKSLHFCDSLGRRGRFGETEDKAKKWTRNSRSLTGLAVGVGGILVCLTGFLRYSPEIWPLMCSYARDYSWMERSA